jgi:CheY-like chemotaxis protein
MSTKLVLVVEDDPDSRATLCVMIEALGFTPLAFPGGKEALAGIVGKQLSLAFLDVMMPEMNGYELLDKIKEDDQFSSLPVILVTAKDQDSDVLEGYQHGADYYIPKPYTLDQIKYAVKTFLL